MRYASKTYIFIVIQLLGLLPCRRFRDGVVIVRLPILSFVCDPRRGRVSVHRVEPLTIYADGDDFVARPALSSQQKFPEPHAQTICRRNGWLAPT